MPDDTERTDEPRLVAVSNRVPPPGNVFAAGQDQVGALGGLVSALRPAMEQHGGLWFGWSGRSTQRRALGPPVVSRFGGPVELATLDLSDVEVSLYYTGFANRTLWPLLHSFPERVIIRRDTYRAYLGVNRRFAEALYPMLRPGDLVWVHDFHLIPLGQQLRLMGWRGRIGFFFHVPFPSPEIYAILPWGGELLDALVDYDLVGVHTESYLRNLSDSLVSHLGGTLSGGVVRWRERSTRVGAYPAGIEPSLFSQRAIHETRGLAEQLSIPTPTDHRLILGVDRLDYTKGIPQRLRAFARLLEHTPSLRGKVSFVQISSPSRTRVPEYAREKERVDRLVGQINGRFSEGGWVPIRYLYRSHSHQELIRFYHDAHVCMVTPLRDGMNLVAKEFVASQGEDPGVLVLSRFAGAASAMRDAVLVNPYDIDGTAEATHRALRMPHSERRRRWESLMEVVRTQTARNWSESFKSDLARS